MGLFVCRLFLFVLFCNLTMKQRMCAITAVTVYLIKNTVSDAILSQTVSQLLPHYISPKAK